MKDKVVIFASTSGIANAVAEELLQRNNDVILCARNADALQRQVKDLEVKTGKKIPSLVWDLDDFDHHQQHTELLFRSYSIGGIFMAAGIMPSVEDCEKDAETLIQTIQANFTSVTVILNLFAEKFVENKKGFISCVSSVAGDRGRQSNYIYGASKAGLSAYLQGLRNRLHKEGLLVQTVKPGTVRTPMTSHLPKSLLMVQPDLVARDIVSAIERKVDVLYTPFFWRYIMSIIRWIPEPIFKRLSL